MRIFLTVSTFLFLLSEPLHAYSIRSTSFQTQRKFQSSSSSPPSQSSSRRDAIIYGAEGEGVWEEESTSSTFSSTELIGEIGPKLGPDLLIRVACAFAPPTHDLHPRDALGANLVNLTPIGADIAVSVKSGEGNNAGLVQILVPVSFTRPCYDNKDLICILNAFQNLNKEAIEKIESKEYTQDYADQLQEQKRVIQMLKEEPNAVDLPNWWTYADLNRSLDKECSEMKYLLNEKDFEQDINTLFQNRYKEETVQVIKTCVAVIGPSGIVMRAYVGRMIDEKTEKDQYFIASLALEFDTKAMSGDELRDNVLDMVESAGTTNLEEEEKEEELIVQEIPVVVVPTVIDDGISRKNYIFQRNLLQARLVMEQASISKANKYKQYTFQRSLLEARIKYDRSYSQPVAILNNTVEKSSSAVQVTGMEQPKSLEEEARLAAKYAQIEDIGERAFAILKDLELV